MLEKTFFGYVILLTLYAQPVYVRQNHLTFLNQAAEASASSNWDKTIERNRHY